jgi:hemoglobin/transferrin/lactoferrin receptor protein
MTAVDAQDRVDHGSAELAETDGYVVFDFTGSIRITENVRLDAGLFNAFDKTYWQWSSIRNRPVGDPMIDYLSAPGRYASVSLRANL